MQEFFANLAADFHQTFIEADRWLALLKGLGMTLKITAFALIIGVVLGVLVAIVRSSHDQMRHPNGVMKLLNKFCHLYLTVIRGTPVMVQLLITYFVVMVNSTNVVLVASITFGINSGAYVAEIVRGGIMSIDKGQMEAGRSIGMSYAQTMWYIIAPQVFKNVLPTLCNEFITLIKETSIAFSLGVSELTNAGDRIRGQTYSPFMPLIAVALIYLVIVMILTKLVSMLERRLRQGDNR